MTLDWNHDRVLRRRYSAFMLASLLVAAVTTTSSFLRALSFVRDLSECSLADSECLYQVQRWFYRRLVAGLVKVDIEVLEVEAAGLCRLLDTGNVEDLIESRWSTNLATAEVRRATPRLTMIAVTVQHNLHTL